MQMKRILQFKRVFHSIRCFSASFQGLVGNERSRPVDMRGVAECTELEIN